MESISWVLDLNSPKMPNYHSVARLTYEVWVRADNIEAAEKMIAEGAADVVFDAVLEGGLRGLRYTLGRPRRIDSED